MNEPGGNEVGTESESVPVVCDSKLEPLGLGRGTMTESVPEGPVGGAEL